jgi:23S rRNA (uracil1939-C5)-methyltransferase
VRQATLAAMVGTLELSLTQMTHGGDALGRHRGQVVFVPGALPGERVRIRVAEEHRGFLRGELLEVLEPSPDRISPPCPYATTCGGCHWQHVAYPAQLACKRAVVVEQLTRLGGLAAPPVEEPIPCPAMWGYRNHCRFHRAGQGRWGFRAARSHTVVPVARCLLAMDPIAAWLTAMQGQDGPAEIAVRALGDGVVTSLTPRPAHARVGDAHFRVSPDAFFQVNTPLLPTLVAKVTEALGLQGGERVVDAYAGVGLFARFLAERAAAVVAVESGPAAIADARANLASFPHVEVIEGRAERVVPALSGRIDAAVVDPPRAGCDAAVIKSLAARPVPRLVYVSCDAATLGRDARRLTAAGYRLASVTPIDLFPHTFHVETISVWVWHGLTAAGEPPVEP